MKQLLSNLLKNRDVHQSEIDFYSNKEGLDSDSFIEYLRLRGLDIIRRDDTYHLGIFKTTIKNQLFCIVDIESNGPDPQKHSIIEIGAIKYQNGKIIDKFSSLVHSNVVPKMVNEVTGIGIDDLLDAPSLNKVLNEFRLFLGDAVFVAHSAKWDYKFLSHSFENCNLEHMFNHKLCTLNLARRYIEAPKHGLRTLNEVLNIDVNHHRAYDDAYSAMKVLEYCFDKIDCEQTTDLLISNRLASKIES
ncbi:MAG: DNA polymerase III epsilon subunit (EC [uncultured Campylobacterales bacterium]|uniref:DNA polymerase III epsilon subunit (EC) n=1 Tax=uncultured Campylobacterales bacterium TaxID=352960 RepID=A0A6S6S586_9BACT|nr:MAG: DNA polymerase III epsilon subunit (EC [uncultured Campylobacterales bacterium]